MDSLVSQIFNAGVEMSRKYNCDLDDDYDDDYDETAQINKALYDAHIEVGFTSEQAIQLVIAIIK